MSQELPSGRCITRTKGPRHEAVCWEALKADLSAFEWIPSDALTPQMYQFALSLLKNHRLALLSAYPEEFLDEELALIAVEVDSQALTKLPKKFLTPELCRQAVLRRDNAFEHVPDEMKGLDLCKLAIEADWRNIRFVPMALRSQLITPAFIESALQESAGMLEFVPEQDRTYELCLKVMEDLSCGRILKNSFKDHPLAFVPEQHRDRRMCLLAVTSGYNDFLGASILSLMPEAVRTYDMCLQAVRVDGKALQDVPAAFVDADMCLAALLTNERAFAHVPDRFKTPFLCREVVLRDDSLNCRYCFNSVPMLEFVPEAFRTSSLCEEAIAENFYALKAVPQELCTDDFYRKALRKYGGVLEFIPPERCTREFCELAFEASHESPDPVLKHVPDAFLSEELCWKAVASDWRELESVPEQWCTDELCRIAVRQDLRALSYI